MHESCTCTGVYSNGYDASLNVKNGFPVFTTVIEANFVNRQEDRFAAFKLSDEDKQEILKLARDPRIGEPACLLYAHAKSFFATLPASSCISLSFPLGWPSYDDAFVVLQAPHSCVLCGSPLDAAHPGCR